MKKNSLLPYLTFLTMGIMVNISGVSVIEMSKKLAVDSSALGMLFSIFIAAASAGTIINGFLLERISIRRDVQISIVSYIIGIIGITLSPNLVIMAVFYSFFGLAMGFMVSYANFFVLRMYDEQIRASKMSILNLFYSIGAIFIPVFAGFLLKNGVNWEMIFLLTIILALIIGFVSFKIDIKFEKAIHDNPEDGKISINKYVIGSILCIIFYEMAELSFTYWLPSYVAESLNLGISTGGFVLGLFWVFMALGRFLSGYILKKISSGTYILLFSVIGLIGYLLFLFVNIPFGIYIFIAIMGFGFSGQYSTIVSYGTTGLKHVPAGLMTILLFSGTVGSVIGMPISSFIKGSFGLKPAVVFGLLFLALLFVTIALTKLPVFKKKTV